MSFPKTDSCSVELVQASICAKTDTPIYTLILEYPRAIHAQLMTHRVFTRNSSSSRAVPIKKAIQQILNNPVKPIWTSNKPGMQGDIITEQSQLDLLDRIHEEMFNATSSFVGLMTNPDGLNVHKQNAGRYLEPFQNIRVCLTSTEWQNWDWLRVDAAAQPEIVELAERIKIARNQATREVLNKGEWHVPFVNRKRIDGELTYWVGDKQVDVETAIRVSMSCTAQTSYRNLDDSLEKADDIYQKLFSGKKIHASPSEHQATPIIDPYVDTPETDSPNQLWVAGITHMDRYENFWSGNFKNWIQNRQLIPGHDPSKESTNVSTN